MRRPPRSLAGGVAKYTGGLGVCVGTTGPGAIHLLNGLYDAALDGAPVIALTGLTFHDLIGGLRACVDRFRCLRESLQRRRFSVRVVR